MGAWSYWKVKINRTKKKRFKKKKICVPKIKKFSLCKINPQAKGVANIKQNIKGFKCADFIPFSPHVI